MGRFQKYVPCPRCRARGADSSGDNLATYEDGSMHCFACGYHRHATHYVARVREVKNGSENKGALPFDFTRDVPARAWKWLLQYGLPYSYWKPYCGYSPAEERLILTVGDPIRFSIGRYIAEETSCLQHLSVPVPSEAAKVLPVRVSGFRKWRLYGDRHSHAELLGAQRQDATQVVVVEDLISGHKVAQVQPTLPLFGTDLFTKAMLVMKGFKRPITLWLDEDQYGVLPKKINRLQTFLDVPVRFIRKRKDPKEYSLEEIQEILSA